MKSDRQERLYHIDDAPTGMSDVSREGEKLYEVCDFFFFFLSGKKINNLSHDIQWY